MNPKRRRADLVVEKLPDETLVYDLARHRAYCLNQSSSFVWNHCDGKTSIRGLADLLARDLHVSHSEEIVRLALDELDRARLLVEGSAGERDEGGLSRRAAARKIGVAGILGALIPTVVTLVAPTAASAVTCVSDDDCKKNPRAYVGLCCCKARKKCSSTGKCSGAVC